MGTCDLAPGGWCDDEECSRRETGCKMKINLYKKPNSLPSFDGFRSIFPMSTGESLLGMVNYRGSIIICTTKRCAVYDPITDRTQEIKFNREGE